MFYKVKIKKIPTARVGMQVQGALSNDTMPFNGKGTTQMNSVPAPSVKKTLQPVARKDANLEAEKGETVIGNIDGSNMPSLFNIGGKRHVNGGTPLNLPDDSFIFSDTKSMMIKDPQILKMFGKTPRKGGYTPADLSKSYDMNKYRKILQDKNSDAIDKKTAEMMIKNYVIKLGALALAQESQKGFPQGIPALAQPYMDANGIKEEDLIPPPPEQAPDPQQQMGQQQMPAPETMPDGSPVAQPQTMEQDMAQMQAPTPNQMMQWGGVRMLKRAQEGMQQPSEEEMAMMQQQGQQQQPQQQEDPMQQMMQQVQEALQQGAQPEEVAAQLIQNQVPPDQVAQIFVQLGMAEEQVQELVSSVLQQMQGGQEQQMDPRQQQQPSEEEMMAMQQQDPQQMQQDSMMQYGGYMELGGYDMPFYDYPEEMARGGNVRSRPIKKYQGGGVVKDASDLTDEDKKTIEKQWAGKTDAYLDYINTVSGITSNTALMDKMYEQYKKDITKKENYTNSSSRLQSGYQPELTKMSRDQMIQALLDQEERNARLSAFGLDPKTTEQNISRSNAGSRTNQKTLDFIKANPGLADLDFTGGYKGQAAYQSYRNTLALPEFSQHGDFQVGVGDEMLGGKKGQITGIDDYNTNTTLGQRVKYNYGTKIIPPKETPCPCVDAKGVAMKNADGTPMLAKKDPKTGKCLPCTEATTTCECEKEDGTKFDPGKNTDGTCKDCGPVTEPPTPPVTPAKWWLQDTVNTMGAFGDLARVKKQMPWEARVDLEEPRPVFLDPTRELANQNEQANIASQATGQFAGPQGQGARLSAIQGQGAQDAANTLSRINNANVGIANQFEGQQVGIRNQEQMANQQMANRVFDKNVIANQQFANAKTAGRNALRQSYNTGVTNKWKTDALNQMYPNYQTDPSSGGRVVYTPTDKSLDKKAEDQTAQEFADSISEYSPEMQKLLFQQKYGKQFGGQQFEHGGYVYSVFPSITL